jgi:V/A-type H+-transporting ATPase subunit E
MSESKQTPEKVSSGVDELIGRLKAEGVEAGEGERERLVAEGRAEAGRLVAEGRAEAGRLVAEARRKIESERQAGEEALRLASRDTLLEVASQLRTAFAGRLRHIVSSQLRDREFLRELILAAAGRARKRLPDSAKTELAVSVVDGDGEGADAELDGLVADIAEGLLRDGVAVETAPGDQGGIQIRTEGTDVVVDLREAALSKLLTSHLAPRFRAMLRGTDT